MTEQFLQILDEEKVTLEEMLSLAEKQREALIKYEADKIASLAQQQEIASRKLVDIENKRLDLIMKWQGIDRKAASGLPLSSIESSLDDPQDSLKINMLKKNLKDLLSRLNAFNSLNRMLANRARHSIHEILTVLSNGNNHVCNVKV